MRFVADSSLLVRLYLLDSKSDCESGLRWTRTKRGWLGTHRKQA